MSQLLIAKQACLRGCPNLIVCVRMVLSVLCISSAPATISGPNGAAYVHPQGISDTPSGFQGASCKGHWIDLRGLLS